MKEEREETEKKRKKKRKEKKRKEKKRKEKKSGSDETTAAEKHQPVSQTGVRCTRLADRQRDTERDRLVDCCIRVMSVLNVTKKVINSDIQV